MSPITQVSSSCLDWNRQGFLALPEDSYETYCDRISKLNVAFFGELSARDNVKKTYDIDPAWVPVEYSNDGLRLWEAGCTWYGESAEDAPTIQLVKSFEKSNTYLGMYHKDEVLSHEYVHAVRAGLGSSYFEEIFAYLLSYSYASGFFSKIVRGVRVALGPVFERSFESSLLLFSFVPLMLLAISDLFVDSYNASFLSLCLIPAALFSGAIAAFFGARLAVRWWQWSSCKKLLDVLVGGNSLPLMVRLTDEEIILFSRLNLKQIQDWIDVQAVNFRWQLLNQAYISKPSDV